jgi:hypothetical protein
VYPAYEAHIAWLEPQDTLQRATNGYKSLLNMMRATDNSHDFEKFKREIYILDKLRDEKFWDTFPELARLK